MSRIMRQADQWLLGSDEDQPAGTVDKLKPPVGTEHLLRGPGIMPGLHQVLDSPGPGPDDGSPERWPAELPGDQILDKVPHIEHSITKIFPGKE